MAIHAPSTVEAGITSAPVYNFEISSCSKRGRREYQIIPSPFFSEMAAVEKQRPE
jgi:hypothetical protein